MALTTTQQTTVNVSWKTVDTVNDKITDQSLTSQVFASRVVETQTIFVDGAATTNLALTSVTKASAYLITANSRYNGDNATTEDAVAPVTFSLGGGTAYNTNILLIGCDLQMATSGNATVAITTIADTDTEINIQALGVL